MVRIAQITDTHLLADSQAEMRGVKTFASLKKVLAMVKDYQPEYLLLTGDLAHEGEPEAYRHLVALIEEVGIPSYWLPGNHDDPVLMHGILGSTYLKQDKSLLLKSWHVILLSSYFENATYGEGYLSDRELTWLTAELERHPNNPTAIALHHHPVATGIDWLDQINVVNDFDFHRIIRQFPQVKVVFFGHIHHELVVEVNQIQYLGTPATCTQVIPAGEMEIAGQVQPWQQPGFRLFDFHDDGSWETTVHRIHWF